MAKKKRKKIADHRNEGFKAREAMFEHNEEKTQLINKQIITKEGLKMYTEEEAMEKAGPVTEYNYNNRYSWEAFKAMPSVNKQEYIKHLQKKYWGITATDLGKMFGVTGQAVMSQLRDTSVEFPKRLPRTTEGKKRFEEEMLGGTVEMFSPAPVHDDRIEYYVRKLSVVCDVNNASDVLKMTGLIGRVYLTAEVIEEKEMV